jgi:hypothetical protein
MASKDDRELFDYTDIKWTMLRTKDLTRVTLVAKSESPINAMTLYLSLEEEVERMRVQLGILDQATDLQ